MHFWINHRRLAVDSEGIQLVIDAMYRVCNGCYRCLMRASFA